MSRFINVIIKKIINFKKNYIKKKKLLIKIIIIIIINYLYSFFNIKEYIR